jgi:hypothetical protein
VIGRRGRIDTMRPRRSTRRPDHEFSQASTLNRSRAWLIAIVLLTTVSGLLSGLVLAWGDSPDHQMGIGALTAVPYYVFTFLWMKSDASERGVSPPPGAMPLVIVLLPVAVPYHLLATRPGWKRAVSLLWFAGFLVLLAAISTIAAMGGAWLAETFRG